MSPSLCVSEDYSIMGGVNMIIRNNAMFTPSQHLTNPGPTQMTDVYCLSWREGCCLSWRLEGSMRDGLDKFAV